MTEILDDEFDYVLTVCDHARESCPVFPGVHESIHWGFHDPAAAEGTEAERLAVFRRVMSEISVRLKPFQEVALRTHGRAIGASSLAT